MTKSLGELKKRERNLNDRFQLLFIKAVSI